MLLLGHKGTMPGHGGEVLRKAARHGRRGCSILMMFVPPYDVYSPPSRGLRYTVMSKAGSNVVGSQPVGKPLHGEKVIAVLLPRNLVGPMSHVL